MQIPPPENNQLLGEDPGEGGIILCPMVRGSQSPGGGNIADIGDIGNIYIYIYIYIGNIEIETEVGEMGEDIVTRDEGNVGVNYKVLGGHKRDEKLLCKICFNSENNVVFLPCGHNCACLDCSNKCDQCPICRGRIKDKLKIYKS